MVDSVTIESEQTTSEGPNDADMAAAYDNQTTGANEEGQQQEQQQRQSDSSPSDSRPEWLPEKFKSPEDMAKAYSELEKKLGTGTGEDKGEAQQDNGKPKIDANASQEEQAEQAIGQEALSKYNQEFAQTGELSEESYQELQDKGIPKEMVDSYIEGQKAVAQRQMGELYETAGSEETLNEAVKWAAQGMEQGDIDAFNAAMDSGNLNQMKLAVRGLMAEYTKANGSEGTRVSGSPTNSSGNTDVYGDMSEVTADMGSKKYQQSEAFRQQVQAKLQRSNVM